MALNLSIFGKYEKMGRYTLFEECPLCGGDYTFRLLGNAGVWECPACGRTGDIDSLRAELLDRYPAIWAGRLASLGTPEPPAGLIVLSQYHEPAHKDRRISTGFCELDRLTDGFAAGALTVLTGKRGSGKSTFASQLALNAINAEAGVCFYSGELSTALFADWLFAQAAGPDHLVLSNGENQRGLYRASHAAEGRIRDWLGEKLILYDNTVIRSDERNTILDRFKEARMRYGCTLFFIDNLMSARFPASAERDFYRQQSAFVRDLVAFAHEYRAHVLLCAHPRKGDGGDANDNVAGTSDITNLASNVIRVDRLEPDEARELGCDSVLSLIKNREFGDLAKLRMSFDPCSRRFTHVTGNQVIRYGWEFGDTN